MRGDARPRQPASHQYGPQPMAVLGTGAVPDAVGGAARTRVHFDTSHVDGDHAHAVSVKDAGDDPDATHGAHLTADVRRIPGGGGEVILLGGPGVGVVTKPGLGLDVGGPAINPVPRRNIVDNVRAAGAPLLDAGDSLAVTISVPGGEEMAKKTLNARLGIVGGISILGTTGIVRPYSTAAFRASVIQAIDVAANQGQTSVVFTTGGRTEKCAMREFPQLDEACFVQMTSSGGFLQRRQHKTPRIYVGAMVGRDQDVSGLIGNPCLEVKSTATSLPNRPGKLVRRPTWSFSFGCETGAPNGWLCLAWRRLHRQLAKKPFTA